MTIISKQFKKDFAIGISLSKLLYSFICYFSILQKR